MNPTWPIRDCRWSAAILRGRAAVRAQLAAEARQRQDDAGELEHSVAAARLEREAESARWLAI